MEKRKNGDKNHDNGVPLPLFFILDFENLSLRLQEPQSLFTRDKSR